MNAAPGPGGVAGAYLALDRRLLAGVDALSAALMVVAGVALVAMMAQVAADVIGKFVFGAPVPATLEMVSNYYMVAVVFLPFAAVERIDGNIHVELVHAALPRVGRRMLEIMAHLLGAVLMALLAERGWAAAMKKYQVGEFIMGSYPIEIWQSRFLVPLGCGLAFVVFALRLARTALWLVRPDLDPGEAGDAPDDPVAGTSI